ncbi:hypothetical protein SAMN04487949_1311 [Halogranum gelatinilyticum]|uniref:DUF5786 domain-containing protein n=1 Tax=Halogranum gelatinilyticum TaxID=660521 RepID=A0A1G9REQ4_9EURY|nr:DUF5786 family protein [Halogranum gelatinilyticum]SDM21799.1 hypothetical protein SAMN04487949_1311 [Halogranum gelatinilyticum]
MGFGSYDESEQENQQSSADIDESEAVASHENDHDGSSTFEAGASNEDLIGRLDEMRDEDDE